MNQMCVASVRRLRLVKVYYSRCSSSVSKRRARSNRLAQQPINPSTPSPARARAFDRAFAMHHITHTAHARTRAARSRVRARQA